MKRPSLKVARRSDGGAVELRVTHARKMRRFGLGADMRCTPTQWSEQAQRFTAKMPGAAGRNATIGEVVRRAAGIIDRLMMEGGFSWKRFTDLYRNAGEDLDLVGYLRRIASELDAAEHHGNATLYTHAARVVERYTKGRPLPFADLSAEVLQGIDQMLRAGGAKDGGVSNIMRTLRAGVNRAIKEGHLREEAYPFATHRRKGYDMSALRGTKAPRPMSEADLRKWKRFPYAERPDLADSVRQFLFLYWSRGMNFADIAIMPKVMAERYVYTRAKLKRRTDKRLSFTVSDERAEILRHFASRPGPYAFPILGEEHRTERQKFHRINKMRKKMNADLRAAAEHLGVQLVPTTQTARHTVASLLDRRGVGMKKIRDVLGHATVGTTEHYVESMQHTELDALDDMLK